MPQAMLDDAAKARRRAPTCCWCPELQLIGYPPEDLVLKPEFVRRTMEARRAAGRRDRRRRARRCCSARSIHEGGLNYNAMLLADGGKVIGRTLEA